MTTIYGIHTDVIRLIASQLADIDRLNWKRTCSHFADLINVGPADPRKVRLARLRKYNPLKELISTVGFNAGMCHFDTLTYDMLIDIIDVDPRIRIWICSNPNITMEMIIEDMQKYPEHAQHWNPKSIARNPNFDANIIRAFPGMGWTSSIYTKYPEVVSLIPHVDFDFANNMIGNQDSWNIDVALFDPKMTREFFYKHVRLFNCTAITNSNIPFEWKLDYYLMQGNCGDGANITVDIMEANINKIRPDQWCIWPHITDDFVEKHLAYFSEFDLEDLIYSPNISIEFAKQFIDINETQHRHRLTYDEWKKHRDIKWDRIMYNTRHNNDISTAQWLEMFGDKGCHAIISRPDVTLDMIEKDPNLLKANWINNPNVTPEFMKKYKHKLIEYHYK